MASTRSKNTPGNYCIEQWSLGKQIEYKTDKEYATPRESMFSGDGLVVGRMGSSELSYNAADVESFLFGIGSSNLVNPKADVKPHLKTLKSLSVIDKIPLLMPESLVVQPDQRQYPMK